MNYLVGGVNSSKLITWKNPSCTFHTSGLNQWKCWITQVFLRIAFSGPNWKTKQKIFLGDEDVEERNYQHLQNVWSKQEMQTFQDFLIRYDNWDRLLDTACRSFISNLFKIAGSAQLSLAVGFLRLWERWELVWRMKISITRCKRMFSGGLSNIFTMSRRGGQNLH